MFIKKTLSGLLIYILLISCAKNSREIKHLWNKFKIEFYINKEANIETEEAVKKTFQNWEKLTRFKFIYNGRNKAGLRKDGKNTVSFLIKWPGNIPINKIAWCNNWYDRKGNIIESDIIFNMSITRFTTLKTNSPCSYYIEGVLAHEIGHMLGMAHIEFEKSIMKSKSITSESYFKGEIDQETIRVYQDLYD